jgi:hypothetical protein
MRIPRRPIGFILVLVAMFAIAAGATVAAASPTATKGQIPDAAIHSSGAVDLSQVPAFISVLAPDGSIAGYISRESLLNPSNGKRDSQGRPMAASWPVFADDLKTIVGYEVPDKGFVPLGVDPASVSPIKVTVQGAP